MAGSSSNQLIELVGNTPLIHLPAIGAEIGSQLLAKLEFLNPGGSVKDRAALGMILDAEEKGLLQRGATIIEATAGNTGIGLALIGTLRGYKTIFTVPERFSEEKVQLIQALGGEVVRTPDEAEMEGAIEKAYELAGSLPNAFVPNQFKNQANPEFHYRTTGPEIYEQTGGRIDAVVIGVGTGGTFTGVFRYLKERIPDLQGFAVEPEGSILGGGPPGPHRVEGIGLTFIPDTLDTSLIDEIIMVTDKEAFWMVRELSRKEGLLVGSSSGANVFASVQIARRLGKGSRVVTVLADRSQNYLNSGIYDKES